MSTRIIKLKLLSQTELVKIETSARTLGDFKAEPSVKALNIDWNSSQLVDKVTKATFNLDEAVLPAVDCIIFHFPTKTKSGAWDYKSAKAEIKNLKEKGVEIPFNYTQATTTMLVDFVTEYYSRETVVISTTKVETVNPILEKQKSVISDLTSKLDNSISKNTIVEVITKDDLQSEYNSIKDKLK